MKFSSQRRANVEKCRACNGQGHPGAKMRNAADIGNNHLDTLQVGMKLLDDPRMVLPRQPMKHRQVSMEEVSVRWKMRFAQAIERLKVRVCDAGG